MSTHVTRKTLVETLNAFEAKLEDDDYYRCYPEELEGFSAFLGDLVEKFELKRNQQGDWV